MNKGEVENILKLAIHAPSGENCQPWHFKVSRNSIQVFNDPERDQSLYNYKQRGSLVAHGAMLENIKLAAGKLGYSAKISIFPDPSEPNHIGTIILEPDNNSSEAFAEYILPRSTNRKPFKKISLSEAQIAELLNSADKLGFGKIVFTQDREKINILANACSVNEKVMFSNKRLHQFFFSHLNWTEEEEEKKRQGFYIKALELPAPAKIALRIAKNWGRIKLLNKIGFAKMVAMGNAQTYASCGAMMAIVIENNEPQNFITAGRIMQRLWLAATKLGLSVQPLTGILFFAQRIFENNLGEFSNTQQELIKNGYEDIRKIFEIKNGVMAMLFRIGQADPPTAKSLKKEPRITFEE